MLGGRYESVLLWCCLGGALFALPTAAAQAQYGRPGAIQPSSSPPAQAAPPENVPAGRVMPPNADSASVPVATTPEVGEVRVEGNRSVALQKILPLIKSRVGRPLDKLMIEDDVRRMMKSKLFISVDPRYERLENGAIVIVFRVVERPMIQYVRIYGSSKSSKTLAKKAGLKPGDPLDPYAVEEGRMKLEEWLKGKAYAQASVTILEGTRSGDRGVKLLVNEGLKQKIWSVKFEGNTVAPDKRLQTQIGSKPPFLYFFKGEVDYDRINDDVRKLTEYYRSLGFFSARVGREWEYTDKQNWMTLRFVIEEGPRYVVGNVSVIGNKKLAVDALTKDLKLNGGDFFDQSKMNRDLDALRDKYGEIGHVFADIQSEPRFLEQVGGLDLVYKIEEGDRYRIGRIDVKIAGDNPHTRRTAILNRLSFRTGDLANTKKLRDSERRLKASSMLANQQSGQPPKIVFSKPGMEEDEDEVEQESQVARRNRRAKGNSGPGVQAPMGLGGSGMQGLGGMGGGGMGGMGMNGQSPDPEPAADDLSCLLREGESAEIELIRCDDPPYDRRTATTVARPQFDAIRPGVVVRGQSPGGAPASSAGSSFGQRPLGRTNPDAISGSGVTRPATTNVVGIPSSYAQPAQPGGGVTQAQYIQPAPTGAPAAQQPPPMYVQQGGYPPPSQYAQQGGYPPANTLPPSSSPPQAFSTQPVYGAPPPSNGAVYAPPGGFAAPGAYGAGAAVQPYGQTVNQNPGVLPPPSNGVNGPAPGTPGAAVGSPGGYTDPTDLGLPAAPSSVFDEPPPPDLPIRVLGQETQTGRLMLGVGVNSNAGLIGNITLEEQNFDWKRVPTSWEEVRNATAFRGGGQQFRIQASPGTVYQQYLVSFNNPYLFNTRISYGMSGSYFTRIYNNWTEKRAGGRVSLGYQFLFDPNLSTVLSFRGENVNISNPTVPTPPQLQQVLGNNAFYSGRIDLIHDTRDSAFLATQGHRIMIGLEEGFGSFVFPRATIDVSQHFLLHERPDTSGRHTLTLANQTGFAGANTPIYENFFAGGYTTLRGFYFRGASPVTDGVQVGGHFQFINTVEYMFPITGDDMLRGVAFTDFGTVEPSTEMKWSDFRISPGLGLRVTVPAMGPAPIALDFAVPVHEAGTDQKQLFSFFIGVAR